MLRTEPAPAHLLGQAAGTESIGARAEPLPHATASGQTAVTGAMLDALPAIVAYIDRNQVCRYVSRAYERWFGQPRSQVDGKPLPQALGAGYSRVKPFIERALQGEQITYEARLTLPNGMRRVMAVYAPDIDAGGTINGFSLLAVDINSHRRPGLRLPDQDWQLRRAGDAIPLFIAQCDRNYRVRFVNKTYSERFGMLPHEAIGKRLSDLIGEEAFAEFRHKVDAALAGNRLEQEIRVPFRIGDHFMLLTFVPECDEHGDVRGLIAAFSDVTRLRRTEEQLHRREQEFKTLVENSPDVITRVDRQLRHLYVNPAIETMFGLKPSVFPGKTTAELGLPPALAEAWENAARNVFASGAEQRFEFELPDSTSGGRYFTVRLIPEPDRDGSVDSILGIIYDITEQTRMEKERDVLLSRERAARIQAETSARARDEFLAIVSHELRAPLNGIQSWAHILESYVKEAADVPLAQRALNGIKTGIAQQVRLIEDLLDVTRMVSGKLRLVKQPIAFLPVVQAALESVRPLAAAKQISLHCNYRITVEQIHGDADRVQQILWNLLSNAIKFTDNRGNVWLDVEASGSSVCVTVRDDGIGISPDFLPQLFDRFSQEDTSSTRGHSGLGLGLFLVRHLVELHEGWVTADSPGEGLGTIFSIYLPLYGGRDNALVAPPEEEGSATVPVPSLQGTTILLIDDQAEARDALSTVLASAGATVFAASSSKEAIDWLQSRAGGELPDVLVSDIAMPVEDGYTVLRKIRDWQPQPGMAPLQRVPALALTAFSQREDRMRALRAGFQMHMAKPVVPEELIVVIANLAQHG